MYVLSERNKMLNCTLGSDKWWRIRRKLGNAQLSSSPFLLVTQRYTSWLQAYFLHLRSTFPTTHVFTFRLPRVWGFDQQERALKTVRDLWNFSSLPANTELDVSGGTSWVVFETCYLDFNIQDGFACWNLSDHQGLEVEIQSSSPTLYRELRGNAFISFRL